MGPRHLFSVILNILFFILFIFLSWSVLPYIEFSSMAREVEEIVRANGCVPATIGILNGRIHVGLQDEELEILATAKDVMKVSRRDFPYVLSQVLDGIPHYSNLLVLHK